jgi:hypothetical protein
MREALLWWWHEVVWRGRLHDWKLEIPASPSPRHVPGGMTGEAMKFRCACGATKELADGRWPSRG